MTTCSHERPRLERREKSRLIPLTRPGRAADSIVLSSSGLRIKRKHQMGKRTTRRANKMRVSNVCLKRTLEFIVALSRFGSL
jgi:hypothetical protein